jgi:hypothetical protein
MPFWDGDRTQEVGAGQPQPLEFDRTQGRGTDTDADLRAAWSRDTTKHQETAARLLDRDVL